MFVSFFPNPRWFFWSALVWTALVIAGWYGFGERSCELWLAARGR